MANTSFPKMISTLVFSSILFFSTNATATPSVYVESSGTVQASVVNIQVKENPIPKVKKYYCKKVYKNKPVVIHIALINKRKALLKTMFFYI